MIARSNERQLVSPSLQIRTRLYSHHESSWVLTSGVWVPCSMFFFNLVLHYWGNIPEPLTVIIIKFVSSTIPNFFIPNSLVSRPPTWVGVNEFKLSYHQDMGI